MDSEEVLSLVNKNDQIIGTILRGDIKNLAPSGGKYIRAVNAFIVRSDGKIWVPIRSTHKKLAPGGLDYSVGAHLQAGEDYIDSLIREFQEEAGFTVTANQCIEIAYNTPFTMAINTIYFNKLYIVKTNEKPVLSDEHTSGRFLSINEAIEKIEGGATTKGYYREDLKFTQDYLNKEAK